MTKAVAKKQFYFYITVIVLESAKTIMFSVGTEPCNNYIHTLSRSSSLLNPSDLCCGRVPATPSLQCSIRATPLAIAIARGSSVARTRKLTVAPPRS